MGSIDGETDNVDSAAHTQSKRTCTGKASKRSLRMSRQLPMSSNQSTEKITSSYQVIILSAGAHLCLVASVVDCSKAHSIFNAEDNDVLA